MLPTWICHVHDPFADPIDHQSANKSFSWNRRVARDEEGEGETQVRDNHNHNDINRDGDGNRGSLDAERA